MISVLSAFAEDHGFYPWMNAIRNATADVAYPNWRITRRNLGVGGYFNDVPRALPVGLHYPTVY
jgi:hypothetical protein